MLGQQPVQLTLSAGLQEDTKSAILRVIQQHFPQFIVHGAAFLPYRLHSNNLTRILKESTVFTNKGFPRSDIQENSVSLGSVVLSTKATGLDVYVYASHTDQAISHAVAHLERAWQLTPMENKIVFRLHLPLGLCWTVINHAIEESTGTKRDKDPVVNFLFQFTDASLQSQI